MEDVIEQDRKGKLAVVDCPRYHEASLDDESPLLSLTLGSFPLWWIRQGQPMRWHSAGLGCYKEQKRFFRR